MSEFKLGTDTAVRGSGEEESMGYTLPTPFQPREVGICLKST
ncbi:hypothetical protein [Paenarthrobacter sp. DKR-5]|nr:hypothetical protein [Paenarthrobacter sp. DKR-5]